MSLFFVVLPTDEPVATRWRRRPALEHPILWTRERRGVVETTTFRTSSPGTWLAKARR
jgi:hypothetical protein